MDSSRFGADFIIGTQYYRPPTPPTEEWEDDFRRIKDLGIDIIKIWAIRKNI